MASILESDERLHGGSFDMVSLEKVLERESALVCLCRIRLLVLARVCAGRGRGASLGSESCCKLWPRGDRKQENGILLDFNLQR